MSSTPASVEILIPTCDHPAALAVTLAGLVAQHPFGFDLLIADQSDGSASYDCPEALSVLRVLQLQGRNVRLMRNLPRRGMAQQRQFLLDRARSPYVLFLDDDVIIEPGLVSRLLTALQGAQCGFVGSALIGPSSVEDVRPHQQAVEFWDGKVEPEQIEPRSLLWQRHLLHNAANLLHVQRALQLTPAHSRLYKIAWVRGCVMYDADKLRAAGGFGFWRELPVEHYGEEVLAQLRVMAHFGGCGLMPSGAYRLELPRTTTHGQVDAPKVLAIHRTPLPRRNAGVS